MLLYDLHDIRRFPRRQEVVSYCRLVQGAKASAGKRSGTSGTKNGNADLQWAFAEAPALCLRKNPFVPAQESGGPQGSRPLREKTREGQSLNGLGA
jgi:transposase